jgi:hypothetical protein
MIGFRSIFHTAFQLFAFPLLVLAPAAAQRQAAPPVMLQSGPVPIRPIVKGKPQSFDTKAVIALRARGFDGGPQAVPPAGAPVILHFERRLQQKDYDALAARGVHVWGFIEGTAYTATVDHLDTDQLIDATKDIVKITGFNVIEGQHKVERSLAIPGARTRSVEDTSKPAESPVIVVELWPNADFERAKAELSEFGQIQAASAYSMRLEIKLSSIGLLAKLAESKCVRYVARKQTPSVQNTHIRKNLNVDGIQSGSTGLTGANVSVGVFDEGHAAEFHPSFTGRLTIGDNDGDTGTHATHVAGTIAGSGQYQFPGVASLGDPRLRTQTLPIVGHTLKKAMSEVTLIRPADYPEAVYPGVAPQAHIVSFGFSNVADTLLGTLSTAPDMLDLTNNSWSIVAQEDPCGSLGRYDSSWVFLDRIISGRNGSKTIKRIPIVFAAGNYRSDDLAIGCGFSSTPPYANYRTVTPPGTAKNVITVGAIYSDGDSANNPMTDFSGYGPTRDGRIKPEVVAPGCRNARLEAIVSAYPATGLGLACGTSQAAPAVSGLIALMMQKLETMGIAKGSVYPSSYKALLIHAAQDLGNPGPDYAYGYGRVRAPETIDLIANRSFSQAEFKQEGDTATQTVAVPAGAKEIKVTLAWDDPPREIISGGGGSLLTNDLDLSLRSPSQEQVLPWILSQNAGSEAKPATRGEDHVNVVEQVSVPNPAAGNWQITVKATHLPASRFAQSYSLVVTVQ